ncbi:MAG: alpha/beta fold hydrolase [Pseudomonadales bacterium]|nr:alpha/beta fold hydrolase [Pseudomonadales bacterium]
MNSNIKTNMITAYLRSAMISAVIAISATSAVADDLHDLRYKTTTIEEVEIFYREAGNPENPTVLLLHGFPTSSHMFRDLIPELAEDYYVIAPDYPGYGFSSMPTVDEFEYTFENTARLVSLLIDEIGVERFSVYLMDYGAPIGFRIASSQPERIESLVIQNGNAYLEGINNDFWEPIKAYWDDRDSVNKGLDNAWWKNVKAAYKQPNMSNDTALRFLTTLGATQWQYTNGVSNVESVSPDTWGHVQPLLDREGNQDIQLQMFYSYGSNPPLYPAWQEYLRKHQPPTLIVWGQNDEIFPAAGAEPYKRDLDNLEYHLLDTGHFALETHAQEIAHLMRKFLHRTVKAQPLAN